MNQSVVTRETKSVTTDAKSETERTKRSARGVALRASSTRETEKEAGKKRPNAAARERQKQSDCTRERERNKMYLTKMINNYAREKDICSSKREREKKTKLIGDAREREKLM